jgi:hypothetical protein
MTGTNQLIVFKFVDFTSQVSTPRRQDGEFTSLFDYDYLVFKMNSG